VIDYSIIACHTFSDGEASLRMISPIQPHYSISCIFADIQASLPLLTLFLSFHFLLTYLLFLYAIVSHSHFICDGFFFAFAITDMLHCFSILIVSFLFNILHIISRHCFHSFSSFHDY